MTLRLEKILLPLAAFDLEVDVVVERNVTAIFGPSGSGKTSLLELIAGLRRPKSALIQLNDEVLTDTTKGIEVPVRLRRIGYVPQDLALFPHLTVRQNLLYGHNGTADVKSPFSLAHVISVLEIESLLPRGIQDLSGGEKQRVAVARAVLSAPRLLLLDEPLSSLDAKLKQKIIPYLKRVREEFQLPILYVTHDVEEVRALCEEVLVMSAGKIIATYPVDSPQWLSF